MKLELTDDEALVLFEWLANHEDRDFPSCDHGSEATVLLRLRAQLDRELIEPFKPDYAQLLETARGRIDPFPLRPR